MCPNSLNSQSEFEVSVTIAKLNKCSFRLAVELISWSGQTSWVDNNPSLGNSIWPISSTFRRLPRSSEAGTLAIVPSDSYSPNLQTVPHTCYLWHSATEAIRFSLIAMPMFLPQPDNWFNRQHLARPISKTGPPPLSVRPGFRNEG